MKIEFEDKPVRKRKTEIEVDVDDDTPVERTAPDLRSIITATPRLEIAPGMGWDDYRAFTALNPSSIVRCDKSELHVKYALTGDDTDSPSLQKGRALHCALLEPQRFADSYESAETRRTAKAKSEAAERGTELLLPKDFDMIVSTALRASQNEDLQRFIKAGQAEVSVFTSEFGCQCKGRIDWISSDPLAILDVKTARDIDERNFSKAFYRYHYDVKLGLYQRWLQRLMNVPRIPVYLLLVENQGPWDCAMVPRSGGDPVPIDDAVLERGAAKGLAWIERIKRCIEADNWPGQGIVAEWALFVPPWEMGADDEDIEGAEVMQ